ncbi:MAG: glycosyltransferase [Eubacterium sp.]
MKILHCMLSCFYIDDYNYQENILPRQNKADGNEVKIIASTETFMNNNTLGYIDASKYLSGDGIEVNRLEYKRIFSNTISKKIRKYKNTEKIITNYKPDIILYHGFGGYELRTVAKYKKNNPNIKLYVDSHEDFHNSGTNFLSKKILHRGFNRRIVQEALPYIDKILCVAYESFDFLQKMYDVPQEKMEFYPLGGIVFDEDMRLKKREKKRRELGIKDDDILLVHSGKLDKYKRTRDIISALSHTNSNKLKLCIIGSIPEKDKNELLELINKDNRIIYLGWKSADELMEYLCASDLYVQPGGQSATMQNAACCGSALALYPYESHRDLMKDTVFYIESIEDMKNLFLKISKEKKILEIQRNKSYALAKEKLDYKKLAARLYQ